MRSTERTTCRKGAAEQTAQGQNRRQQPDPVVCPHCLIVRGRLPLDLEVLPNHHEYSLIGFSIISLSSPPLRPSNWWQTNQTLRQ